MCNIKKTILAAAIATVPFVAGAHDVPSIHMSGMSVSRTADGMLALTMDVNPAAFDMSRNREVLMTPVVYNADSTKTATYPPFIIAGHNRYYRYVRDGRKLPDGASFYRARHDGGFTYTALIPFEDWMEVSTVAIDQKECGCCGEPEGEENTPVAELDFRPRSFVPCFVSMPPTAKGEKVVDLKGSAYIDFPVNRTEIYPDYRKNPSELKKIINTIDVVKNNPDATITDIFIKGFASPEGSYTNNIRLAKGRTQSLKEYVRRQYGFNDTVFHTDFEPEDWAGLRDSVLVSVVPNRKEILEIIDSDLEPDPKNAAIQRRFPTDYAFLLKNVYPALRHSDYIVRYRIREYTDVDEIKRVLRERPQNLNLNEMYLAANTYEVGSPEYYEVFDVAVRMFPSDPVSNVNAANSAMASGDYTRAARYLEKAGDTPDADYARGVLQAIQGNYEEAVPLLEKARNGGISQAADALAQISTIRQRKQEITYIPDAAK